jgi:hypothetical protein
MFTEQIRRRPEMASSRKWLAGAALAAAVLGAGPAAAQQQGWWNSPNNGWRDNGPGWHGYPPQPGYGYYGPGNGYGYQGEDNDYGVDTGVIDVAICPPGYHLGRRPGLCWPDRN